MWGRATLTTVVSRKAMPEPATVAAISQRPAADASRMFGSAGTDSQSSSADPIRRCAGAGRRRCGRLAGGGHAEVVPRWPAASTTAPGPARSRPRVARTSPAPIVNDRAAVPLTSTAMAPSSGGEQLGVLLWRGGHDPVERGHEAQLVGRRRRPVERAAGREQVGSDVRVVVEGEGVRAGATRGRCRGRRAARSTSSASQAAEGIERLGAHGGVVVEDLVGAPRPPGLDVSLLRRLRRHTGRVGQRGGVDDEPEQRAHVGDDVLHGPAGTAARQPSTRRPSARRRCSSSVVPVGAQRLDRLAGHGRRPRQNPVHNVTMLHSDTLTEEL